MQENEKKIIVRVMNILAIIASLGTIALMGMINILAMYSEEYSKIFENIINGKVTFIQQCIIFGICIILNILSLILTKNMKKNEPVIAVCMAISMMFGGLYNIIAGFVSIIVIYKKKKRRKIRRKCC